MLGQFHPAAEGAAELDVAVFSRRAFREKPKSATFCGLSDCYGLLITGIRFGKWAKMLVRVGLSACLLGSIYLVTSASAATTQSSNEDRLILAENPPSPEQPQSEEEKAKERKKAPAQKVAPKNAPAGKPPLRKNCPASVRRRTVLQRSLPRKRTCHPSSRRCPNLLLLRPRLCRCRPRSPFLPKPISPRRRHRHPLKS